MGPLIVVLHSPGFDHLPGLGEGCKPVLVQALRTEVPVERLDVGIIGGLARPRELQRDPVPVSPGIQRL